MARSMRGEKIFGEKTWTRYTNWETQAQMGGYKVGVMSWTGSTRLWIKKMAGCFEYDDELSGSIKCA